MRNRHLFLAILVLTLGVQRSACAAETITYTYDANGRLVQAQTTGGRANGVTETYQFDAADNQTSRVTVGAPPRPTGVIIVPLNGFTIIPIYN
jgi:uncharacterized protein RhaS with RHS repeats